MRQPGVLPLRGVLVRPVSHLNRLSTLSSRYHAPVARPALKHEPLRAVPRAHGEAWFSRTLTRENQPADKNDIRTHPASSLPTSSSPSNVCVAYSHRKTIMFNDLTNYTCCNGDTCISGRCGEKSCPEFCLCVEAFCCFPSAVATNRFMIQDEMRVENTPCDNFLIGFMLCLNQLACIFRIAAMISQNDDIERAADILDCMADVTYCSVCACMQTQHQEQLKMRNPNARPPARQGVMQPPAPQVIYQMPPGAQPAGAMQYQQQHYQQQAPPPPSYGYAQQPAPTYGYAQAPPPQGNPQYRY